MAEYRLTNGEVEVEFSPGHSIFVRNLTNGREYIIDWKDVKFPELARQMMNEIDTICTVCDAFNNLIHNAGGVENYINGQLVPRGQQKYGSKEFLKVVGSP